MRRPLVPAPRRPRAPPAAGASLRQGAPAPALLCPSGRASRGPCLLRARGPPPALIPAAGGTPSPRPGASQPARAAPGASRRVRAATGGRLGVLRKGPTCAEPGKKGSGRAADRGGGARPRRPPRPGPPAHGMAPGSALPLMCAPTVWVAAALLLCVPRTSGRTRRPAPSPARRLGARAGGLALSGLRLRGCAPGLSPDQGAPRRAPPRRARLGPAPRRPGLLPMRRALGTAKCFQRPGERRRRPRGSPRPGVCEGRECEGGPVPGPQMCL